jgi:hypothetical protein
MPNISLAPFPIDLLPEILNRSITEPPDKLAEQAHRIRDQNLTIPHEINP